MRRLLVLLIVLAAGPAAADTPDDAAKATALLDQLGKAPSGDARAAAAKELAGLGAHARDTLRAFLARTRTTTLDERRAVLVGFGASVPDAKGKFETPNREKDKQLRAGDDIDWLAELARADLTSPAVGEVTADIAALRALGASKDIEAAPILFDAAFADDTIIYRDECGRQIRALSPFSIPGLIRIAEGKGYDRKRYATYQLERLDRQEPGKALGAAADDEDLEIAILAAFRDTKHREAVEAVWKLVDDDAPRVRAAARETWLAYVTGPPPPPAPKKKLVLPGGKLSDKEKPLWFTYRELADQLLRRNSEELLAEPYDEKQKLDLEAVTRKLFAYFDGKRTQADSVLVEEARHKRGTGDLAGAIALFDRLLVTDPNRAEKAEMAAAYLAYGDALGKSAKWPDAAAAYSKAHGLDPQGKDAAHALASQHYALGKALEAEGKDGGAQFRKAAAIEPQNERAQEAAGAASGGGRRQWMLLVGGAAALLAALLFGVGMMRRRAA